MIRSDLANRLTEMVFKETVDRTNRRAITGFMGTADGIKAAANCGGSAEFMRWERNNAARFCFMSD